MNSKKISFALPFIVAIALGVLSLAPVAGADAPVILTLSAVGGRIEAAIGDTTDVGSSYRYAEELSPGLSYVALDPKLTPAPDGKSAWWEGTMNKMTAQVFVSSVQGSGIVTATLRDLVSAQQVATQTVQATGYAIYLPVFFKNYSPPTPTPSPTPEGGEPTPTPIDNNPTPIPTPTPILGMVQVSGTNAMCSGDTSDDYDYTRSHMQQDCMTYRGDDDFGLSLAAGSCVFSFSSTEHYYMLTRTFVEFDTRAVTNPSEVVLQVFGGNMEGNFAMAFHRGTWDGGFLLSAPPPPGVDDVFFPGLELPETMWDSFESPPLWTTTNLQNNDAFAIPLPLNLIEPGQVTRLAIVNLYESDQPPLYSCLGGIKYNDGNHGVVTKAKMFVR